LVTSLLAIVANHANISLVDTNFLHYNSLILSRKVAPPKGPIGSRVIREKIRLVIGGVNPDGLGIAFTALLLKSTRIPLLDYNVWKI